MSSEQMMRESFERWCIAEKYSLDKSASGGYSFPASGRWAAWQAAIESLPRMTEDAIVVEMAEAIYANRQVDCHISQCYSVCRDAARALAARLPHIIKPSEGK